MPPRLVGQVELPFAAVALPKAIGSVQRLEGADHPWRKKGLVRGETGAIQVIDAWEKYGDPIGAVGQHEIAELILGEGESGDAGELPVDRDQWLNRRGVERSLVEKQGFVFGIANRRIGARVGYPDFAGGLINENAFRASGRQSETGALAGGQSLRGAGIAEDLNAVVAGIGDIELTASCRRRCGAAD